MSNLRFMGHFTDRDGALAYLNGRKSRKIAHNTYVHLNSEGDPAVTYHSTDIVTYRADGTLTLDCGGWPTTTTANRLNHFTPYFVNGRYPRSDWAAHRLEVRTHHSADPLATLTSYDTAATL